MPYDIKRDMEILKKYRHGKDLDQSDADIVNELCAIGLMNTGISIKRVAITAKTTDFGNRFYPNYPFGL